jgi:membrane-associated phospholipid phosphatase
MRFFSGIAIIWKRQWMFYVLSVVFLCVLGLVAVTHGTASLVEWFSRNRTPFLTDFFRALTLLGDGWIIAGVILVVTLVRLRNAISLTAAALLASVIVQILKRLVFYETARPFRYFNDLGQALPPIDGFTYLGSFSFPSGHAAGAFALFLGLALLRPGAITGALCFVAAALAALSRVYLAQHFTDDVLVGALIGILACSVVFAVTLTSAWYRKEWARYSILGIKQAPF